MSNPIGKSVYTREGIETLRNATIENRQIRPVKFRVSKDDVEIYNGVPSSEFKNYWYEGRIAGYRKIDKDRAEIILEIPPDKATRDGATFALLDESNTILMLAKPPFPFPPLMRQRLLVQIVWQNLEEIVDFKYLPSEDFNRAVVDWSIAQQVAEFVRTELATGIVDTRYSYKDPLKPIEENNIASVGDWTVIGLHNHGNYYNMPGLGQFRVNANGFLLTTRHNDYRCYKKSSGKEVVENSPPQSPNLSIDGMKDLFSRYSNGSLREDEKHLFRWDLAYLELFFAELDSPTDLIEDTFKSFRHLVPTLPANEIFKQSNWERLTGLKSRFENRPYFCLYNSETGKYIVSLYRILTHPIEGWEGKRWDEIVEPYEDYEIEDIPFTAARKRFKLRSDIDLETLINQIPGLDGEGAEITAVETPDKATITGRNLAYYFRHYNVPVDAVNQTHYVVGWSDPTLIVALTQSSEVYGGVSYLIPLELLLRTPLETWNPYGLVEVETISGKGTEDAPYSGVRKNSYWFLTPVEFFTSRSASTVADTRNTAWVKDPNGIPRLVHGSGVWIAKEIKDLGWMRFRYPIFFDAHEMGKLGYFLQIQTRRLALSMLSQAANNFELGGV